MFGYLRPYKNELKLKDIKKYSAYYCALCKQIRKDYGIMWSAFLNYESVYVMLFLETITEAEKENITIRCPLNLLMKKKANINPDVLQYAAFVNMVLVKFKFDDDVLDEGKFLEKSLNKRLSKKKKFKELYSDYDELVEQLKL